jgi:hypothetical protein
MVEDKDKELAKFKEIMLRHELGQERDIEHNTQELNKDCDDVLLFFSFDIVNSTLYKTINNYQWVYTIDKILKLVKDKIKEKISKAEVWRVFGDEIIFIANVVDKESIGSYISHIHKVLIESADFIEEDSGCEERNNENCLKGNQKLISLQACAWIATVTDISKIKEATDPICAENVFEIFEEGSSKFREFRGVDIDTGFRLAKETVMRRLTISFELAYLISEMDSSAKNIRVITYKKLKGVWNNLAYPIIWYYDGSHNKGCSFEQSIPFDAVAQEGIYAELMMTGLYKNCGIKEIRDLIGKILKERGLENKINNLKRLIEDESSNYKEYLRDPKLELHCVAVCYNEYNEILLVKRAKKEFMPAIWEFGCAKASSDKGIEEIIKEEYKRDFGIDIEVYIDKDRTKDQQPVPLAIYTIKKKNEMHKGIIFAAKIIGNAEVKLNKKKHSDYRFISLDELENGKIETENLVPDAIDTLHKVFNIIMERKNEGK